MILNLDTILFEICLMYQSIVRLICRLCFGCLVICYLGDTIGYAMLNCLDCMFVSVNSLGVDPGGYPLISRPVMDTRKIGITLHLLYASTDYTNI